MIQLLFFLLLCTFCAKKPSTRGVVFLHQSVSHSSDEVDFPVFDGEQLTVEEGKIENSSPPVPSAMEIKDSLEKVNEELGKLKKDRLNFVDYQQTDELDDALEKYQVLSKEFQESLQHGPQVSLNVQNYLGEVWKNLKKMETDGQVFFASSFHLLKTTIKSIQELRDYGNYQKELYKKMKERYENVEDLLEGQRFIPQDQDGGVQLSEVALRQMSPKNFEKAYSESQNFIRKVLLNLGGLLGLIRQDR